MVVPLHRYDHGNRNGILNGSCNRCDIMGTAKVGGYGNLCSYLKANCSRQRNLNVNRNDYGYDGNVLPLRLR